MDVESKAVAGAVKEALHPTVLGAGLITRLLKDRHDPPVDRLSLHTVLYHRDSLFLGPAHRIVQLPERIRGPTLHHGAGHVRIVPAPSRPRGDIHPPGFVWPQP